MKLDSRRGSPAEILALWREFKASGDPKLRDRLVMTYAPMVKYIVYRKVRELPAHCEVEDLIACGLEALIASVDRFDPERGATLEQFVWTRVHGAVLDELRRLDWAPRSLRRWERDITRARDQFARIHGRRPTQPEMADALAISVSDLRLRQDEIARSNVTSLNTLVSHDGQGTAERIELVPDEDERSGPEEAAAMSEAKRKFRSAFAQLPRREREIVVMLYVKHLTLSEVGEVLGISESRVCQIHTQLKKTLRRNLASHEELFAAVA